MFHRKVVLLLLVLLNWTSPCAASGQEGATGATPSEPLRPRLDRPLAEPPNEDALPRETQPPNLRREVVVEPERSAAPEARRVWYGWQNLAVDGAGQTLGFTLGVLMANSDGGLVGLTTGVATYALGGPIVHFAHGNVGKGFGSLGLRVGLPVAGAIAGVLLETPTCRGELFCGLTGGFLGLAGGTVSAIALDASVLAYKTVPEESTVGRTEGFGSLRIMPHLSPEGAGLSANAAF